MGWFEDQVKTRKKLDAKTFEDSFLSLAGIRTDSQKNLSDEAVRENYAISQILSYFHHAPVEIPKNIDNFNEKLNYVLSQCDIEYHKVELNENYEGSNNSPLLIFTFLNNIPVVLFPKKDKYYFINYQTGKKVYIEAALVNGIELEAYSFYRPLPNKKVSIKEYAKYIQKSIKLIDIIMLILVSAIAAGVGLLLPYLTKMLTGKVAENKDINQFIMISTMI